jgi:hypothetical protein
MQRKVVLITLIVLAMGIDAMGMVISFSWGLTPAAAFQAAMLLSFGALVLAVARPRRLA